LGAVRIFGSITGGGDDGVVVVVVGGLGGGEFGVLVTGAAPGRLTTRFAGAGLGFGVMWATTGTSGAAATRTGELARETAARRGALASGGASTRIRLGDALMAMPCGPAGSDKRRGIIIPAATAIPSRSAAIPRSIPVVPIPSPAESIPFRAIGRPGRSLDGRDPPATMSQGFFTIFKEKRHRNPVIIRPDDEHDPMGGTSCR